ncbi:MAG: hypothetical protein ACFFG0_30255 [Candidatus Thorarchaeota archaeon]
MSFDNIIKEIDKHLANCNERYCYYLEKKNDININYFSGKISAYNKVKEIIKNEKKIQEIY